MKILILALLLALTACEEYDNLGVNVEVTDKENPENVVVWSINNDTPLSGNADSDVEVLNDENGYRIYKPVSNDPLIPYDITNTNMRATTDFGGYLSGIEGVNGDVRMIKSTLYNYDGVLYAEHLSLFNSYVSNKVWAVYLYVNRSINGVPDNGFRIIHFLSNDLVIECDYDGQLKSGWCNTEYFSFDIDEEVEQYILEPQAAVGKELDQDWAIITKNRLLQYIEILKARS